MNWISDNTGRFTYRPYYGKVEIDRACDALVSEFLLEKYNELRFPIKTDDLEVMIEQETSDFDPFADLRRVGEKIEGMTTFFPHKKPVVAISEHLSRHYWQENRKRTTLAHELGHVILHAEIWEQNRKFNSADNTDWKISCNRAGIENPEQSDWMEWQAYYASGAYLMPISRIMVLVDDMFDLVKSRGPFLVSSSAGVGLRIWVKKAFHISLAAAEVRLLQLGYLTRDEREAFVCI